MSKTLETEKTLAERLQVTIGTIQRWRAQGGDDPLPFKKLGSGKRSPIRFDPDETAAWLSRRTFTNTSQYDQKKRKGK